MTTPTPDATAYDHDDVQRFLNSYGVALAAGDLDTIAETYAFPALVVTDEASVLISEPDTVRESFRGAAESYRERGLVGAVAQIRSLGTTSAGLVWADVRWSYRDEYAAEADTESFRYLLRRGRETFQICVVVPVDPLA
ncbi:hypothetical protein ACFRCR_03555 [Oerskovia sp. NPDC056781]|uniref:hypothetical protein n=1 Tax=Oerskovia sp. NPDC056781 TaxID=3345942 RepID=UPI00366F6085